MQKVIDRVLYIMQTFQKHLKKDRSKELESKLIKLAKVFKEIEKKCPLALQKAKEFLYFHNKVSKLGHTVNGYQCKLLISAKEYLRKRKIKFEIVDFKCECGKVINMSYPLWKRDQSININLEQQL